jgi:RHS repeat-associated protein
MAKLPVFTGRITRSIGIIFLGLLFLSPESFALNPPPTVHDAYCWINPWATARLSQKIINKDDIVTLKVNILGGPPNGMYCGYSEWHKQGVSSIILKSPDSSCFQIVDYRPKEDGLHQVTPTSGAVTWSAVVPPDSKPPSTVNDGCFCRTWRGGQWSDRSTCSVDDWKTGHYGPGDSFTLTLKATCSNTDSEFKKADVAVLAANWGGAACGGDPNIAQDYYKFGGQAAVYLEADPKSLPADGSQSTLTARVIESSSGVALPRQQVNFLGNFGIFNPVSAETDSTGAALATVASPGRWGEDLIQAFIPGSQASTWVTFTQVDNLPVNSRSKFGKAVSTAPVNDPVHAGLGNYIYSKYLFSFPGKGLPFNLEMNYNSLDNAYNGPLGFGWTHTFNVVLTPPVPPSTDVTIKWGDGHEDTFRDDGSGKFIPFNCNTTVTLTKPDAGHYLATLYNKNTYLFDSSGRLLTISDLNGNQISLTHSTRLDRITDTAGRQIDFIYSGGRLSAIASPLKSGNTVSFQYDGAGNLTGLIDPRGKTWGFIYDGSHRILTQVDAKGVTLLTNTYDGSGRVAQQQDGGGNLTSFEYNVDSSGTRTKITPPSGNTIWHYYDLAYNLTQVIDGEGHQAQFSSDSQGRLFGAMDKSSSGRQIVYDAGGNPTMAVDGTGAMARFAFNAQNRPTSVTDPLNHTTLFGYDVNGNVTDAWNANGNHMTVTVGPNGLPGAISDFLGQKWNTSYNGSGLPQTMTDPNGAQTGFTFDAGGRLTNLQLPVAGVSFQTTYDEGGNVLTRTDPLGRVSALTYDNNNALTTVTFVPTGAVTTYTYDWAGRPKSVTNALGGVTTYTYDADGNLLTSTDPDGVTVNRQYDKSNRLTALVDPLGHRVFYGYDAAGNLTSISNELGNTWTTTFDAEGRPTQTTDPLGNTFRSSYDAAGRLKRLTDPLNYSQTYEYDAAGRVVSTTQPDGGVVGYVHDANGRPRVVTDPSGHFWQFAYDLAGRLASETDPNAKTASYAYDGLGRVISETLRDGKVLTYTYDLGSRLTRVTLPGPVIINYAYDAAGNLTGITDPSGTTTMTYDLLGRRLTRTDPNGKTMAFSYTPAGRLKTLTYPGGWVATYSYDTVGRLADIADWKGNHTTFQYDSVNRVTQVNLPNGTRTIYTYDGAGRVATLENRKSDDTVLDGYAYTYTSTGQIASVLRTEPVAGAPTASRSSYSFDSVNRLLKAKVNDTTTTYAFDDRGNLLSKTSGGATTTYAYDVLNRLVSVADGTNTTTYTYDGSGNRLSKTYNGSTTRYVREGGTTYCTLDGSGNVQSYNLYAGSLLYSLDGAGTRQVYHGDERGSVVAITDASQNLVQSYAYDPYGKVIGGSGSLPNAFRYVGAHGVLSDEDGLYHMQARYYDPEVRRFIHEDPLGLSAGLNLFEYTGGDPINNMDPSGTDFKITREGIYSASNVPIDVVWTEPVPSGGYFPKWRNDYLGTPSRTPGTYWGGVSPGKEIMPFELQPKAIMPKNVQPQNLWGLAPVEKTSVKGMSWWKLPPETPVGLPEGLATSPETGGIKRASFPGKASYP